MKLSAKIAVSMGALAALMAVLGVYLIMQMSKVNDVATELSQRQMPLVEKMGVINNAASEYRLAEVLHIYATDSAQMREYEKQQQKWAGIIDDGIQKCEAMIAIGRTREIFQTYLVARQKYRDESKKVLELSRELRTEQAITLLLGESLKQYNLMSAALDNTIGAVKQHVNQVNNDADAMYDNSRLTGIILIVGAILIAVFLTLLLVRNTIRQLGKDPGELNGIAHRVVNGDYDIDDGSRKIGVYGAIVEMVNALKRNIDNAQHESENAKEQSRKAQEAMEQAEAASREAQSKTEAMLAAADKLEQVGSVVSSASTELSAQIEQSDRGAAESAQRLSEAATAMNEMNATVQEVAKNAGSASNASAETKQKAEVGAEVVAKAVHSIEQVHQMSLELKDDMAQLNEHAQNITRIMGVISDIADQTNLLALNAAIEAARAGDAGRGFAVVADEVRKLAEKTMASTQDVGNAIKSIQESTAKSMTGVDNAVERISEANELASRSGQALGEIVATVEATADQVNAIATASEEQSAASEEINQSIVQVNDMSRQTAEAMAEAAKAVSNLAMQAQGLTDLIQELKEA
ncbi:methyl-accepting chemotaxis protein [Desulfovibrio fairfieldensis]|uniref:Chemotaxis protein n=1 Tax=Desulfovibrio fairfieldensis TaxID=44742 RepID=A0A0X8JKI3_9BACT|nr:methyl-accepting chemotaxis protein [Desulfovibrio fairfieldensis]AMD90479.1 chemotaxis protein [Desulfovibrio fairfieldensis]